MLKNLKLDKPIVFIDVETTGLNPSTDRIVELSILKVCPDGHEEYKSHLFNPEIPIPSESTSIHGITDADVAEKPIFRQLAKSLRDFLEDCDMAGFNVIKFDLPFLEAEFTKANIDFSRKGRYLIDSQVIFHKREPRDLQAAYRKYCGKEIENAHRAEGDAKAAAEVLDGQLEIYDDLPKVVADLSALCLETQGNFVDSQGKFIWKDNEIVCNFGKKYNGVKLEDIAKIDASYLKWISEADFSKEVKDLAINALNGDFPKK